MRSLRSLDRTSAQLKYACAYSEGEVVVPVRDYRRYGLEKKVQYTVLSRDVAQNQVTVAAPDGSAIAFDPSRCADKTTYAVQEIAIAPGDQLRWTRNDTERGVRNGQMVTIAAIDAKGTATLKDASGNETTVELTGQQYLDYALVSTTYSSQGKTADQVLVAVDSTISKEGLYVAVSRAKQKLSLYTASKEKLFKQAERSTAKENPSDYLTLFNLVNPDAENQKTAGTARDATRCRSIRIPWRSRWRVRCSSATAPLYEEIAQLRQEVSELRAEQQASHRSMSQMLGVWSQELRNAAESKPLERQAERIGEAAQGIIDGARQLEHTAAAVARLDGQLEQKAERLSG